MQQPDPAQMQHAMSVLGPFVAFVSLVGTIGVIIPFWQIFKKAGMAAPLSLLMIVPIANLVMLYVLAFSRWKVVPAPDFGAGYPPPGYPVPQAYPPPGYVPPAGGYAAPPTAPGYVPPSDPPRSL